MGAAHIMGGDSAGYSRLNDLVSLSGVLQVCEMEVVLLGGQGPRAFVEARALNEAIFCDGEADFDFRGRFVLPPDWCMLGYIHETPEGSWCHGTPLESGMAFTIMPEGISEFMLRKGSRVSVVLLPLDRLRGKLAELVPHQAEIPARQLRLFRLSNEPQGVALRLDFERIGGHLLRAHLLGDTQTMREVDVGALLTNHLLAGLSASAEDRAQCSRSRRTHYLIVQRVEQYMRANMRHDIYNNELCAAADVSERTLRYAFDDLTGISPNRYLAMLRLCTACRSLSLSDASRRSVKSVALSCGLWDLSRFADNYRRVFGELPRETLMRAPAPELASSV